MLEHDWDHFDELVQALAARASDSTGLDSVRIRTKLLKLFEAAAGKSLTFDYLTSLSDNEVSPREQFGRKLAWTLQHALASKVWCVNSRILSHRADRLYSPIVEQLKMAGLHAGSNRLQQFARHIRDLGTQVHGTIDAVLVSRDCSTIYVAKGCTFRSALSTLGHTQRGPLIRVGGGSLWDPSQRLIEKPFVDAAACRSLVLAWGLLKDTFNHLTVIPIYSIIDEVDATWQFQIHTLEEPWWSQFPGRRVAIDRFPILRSSFDMIDSFREDPDAFNHLPRWVQDSPLYSIPPDRPARSLMNLDILQREQGGNQREVVPIKASVLAEEIGRRFDLFYTKDAKRHDLLHLTRRGLVHKHPENRFSITPLGLARHHLAVAVAQGGARPEFAQETLKKIYRQAELLWKFRNL
jgi:hypothetical protein